MGATRANPPAAGAAGPSVDDRGSIANVGNPGSAPGNAARRGQFSGDKANAAGEEIRKAPTPSRISK